MGLFFLLPWGEVHLRAETYIYLAPQYDFENKVRYWRWQSKKSMGLLQGKPKISDFTEISGRKGELWPTRFALV